MKNYLKEQNTPVHPDGVPDRIKGLFELKKFSAKVNKVEPAIILNFCQLQKFHSPPFC